MTQSGSKSNDLLLRFRVEQPAKETPPRQIGGWVMWCLLGVLMGVCGWWVSKQLLVDGLTQQLTESESRSEALVTLQRLSMLGDDATEPLSRALLHQDERVAQSAYLMLDGRISAWQEAPVENEANFTHLAALLDAIPDDSLPTRLALAGSLATRLLVFCGEQTQQDFAQAIAHCESVVSRSMNAQFRPTSENDAIASSLASTPVGISAVPPPLPPVDAGDSQQATGSFSMTLSDDSGLGDQLPPDSPSLGSQTVPVGSRASLYSSTGSPGPQSPMASIRMVPRQMNALNYERVVSESSVMFPDSVGNNRPAELMQHPTALSLDAPMQQVVSVPEYDLSSIPDLPIGQLVRLLAAEQTKVAQTAALALKAKGMDDRRIELASRIAGELSTGTRTSKVKMAQDVVGRYNLDEPSPWLLWIAEDSDPEVRKTAIGLLHGQVDEGVGRQLRSMLGFEADAAVALTLRQVLASNPGLPLR